jgi:DNA-binding NarL/FixJ family response regulator
MPPFAPRFALGSKGIQDFLCAVKRLMAWKQSRKQQDSTLFILLDLAMPGMNGMETASILKRLMPQVLIVAFSMHAEFLNKSLASTVGIDGAVAKLDGIGKVVDCFRALLQHVST